MSISKPFYVEHTNNIIRNDPNDGQAKVFKLKEDLNEKLGVGLAVGVINTAEGPKTMVIWEGQRFPSPSFHDNVELGWIGLWEEDDAFGSEEEDDTDDGLEAEAEDEETVITEEDGNVVSENLTDSGDFSNDVELSDTEVVNSEVPTPTVDEDTTNQQTV